MFKILQKNREVMMLWLIYLVRTVPSSLDVKNTMFFLTDHGRGAPNFFPRLLLTRGALHYY